MEYDGLPTNLTMITCRTSYLFYCTIDYFLLKFISPVYKMAAENGRTKFMTVQKDVFYEQE